MKKLWIIFGAVFIFSFSILGWIGTEIFRQVPPIPKAVVTTDGQTLIAYDEVLDGQNVWQAMGGMQVGSVWAMVHMSRRIGRQIISIANRYLSSISGPVPNSANGILSARAKHRQHSGSDFKICFARTRTILQAGRSRSIPFEPKHLPAIWIITSKSS